MLSNYQPLPHNETRTWFVIADRSVARFFESEGGVKAWRPLRALEHREEPVPVMQVFARDISKIIEEGRIKNAYDRLVLVAPPRFLGELKSSLSPKAEGLVYRTLDQELTQLDDAALRERLRPVLFE